MVVLVLTGLIGLSRVRPTTPGRGFLLPGAPGTGRAVQNLIQAEDNWYVRATSARADDRARVLKHGETLGLFDRCGDIEALGLGEQGLYHEGTRFLSALELRINGARPLLLNSAVREDNSLLMVDLTTPDLYQDGKLSILKDTLHIFRAKLLWEGAQYERIRLVNYSTHPTILGGAPISA